MSLRLPRLGGRGTASDSQYRSRHLWPSSTAIPDPARSPELPLHSSCLPPLPSAAASVSPINTTALPRQNRSQIGPLLWSPRPPASFKPQRLSPGPTIASCPVSLNRFCLAVHSSRPRDPRGFLLASSRYFTPTATLSGDQKTMQAPRSSRARRAFSCVPDRPTWARLQGSRSHSWASWDTHPRPGAPSGLQVSVHLLSPPPRDSGVLCRVRMQGVLHSGMT